MPATPGNVSLAAEAAFAADFTRHARDFAGEPVQLVHHRVERFFELKDFSAHIDSDLARTSHRSRLRWQPPAMFPTWPVRLLAMKFTLSVRSFVHVPPTPGTSAWPPNFAFRTDFARHAGHFTRETRSALVHHRVDGVFQRQNFALHIDRNLARH